jgi:hypothetical protein
MTRNQGIYKTPAVGVEEGHDVEGHEIVVPYIIYYIAKEFGDASFGRLVTGVVIEAGFMGGLCTNANDCRGVVGDVFIVEGEVGGTEEHGIAVFGFVLGGILRMAVREWIPFNWS